METSSIISILMYTAICIGYVCERIISAKRLNAIKAYEKYFENNKSLTDAMLEYCLSDIQNRAVERQDYEEAAKCRELIKNLQTIQHKDNGTT